jgi:hypothetical protein
LAQDKPVTLAAIAGAHGVTGEVRLKLFGEGVAALKRHKVFNQGALTLKSVRDDNKGDAIARFAEIADRNDGAERVPGVGCRREADQVRVVVFAAVERRKLGAGNREFRAAKLLGGRAVGDLGEADDGATFVVVAQRFQRQRPRVEAFVALERRDALAEQLEADFARHAVRAGNGRERDGFVLSQVRQPSAVSSAGASSVAAASSAGASSA